MKLSKGIPTSLNKLKENNYNFSADIIRVLAIIGVVFIHTANAVYARPDFFGGLSWWLAIIGNSLFRISIPLFIMLSGYFLLNKNESYPETIKRTVNRIVIPLLFWFVMDLVWNGGYPTFTYLNFSAILRLLTVNVFDLYFFIILAGLYLIAPLLRALLHRASFASQKNFTIFSIVFGIVYFFIQYSLSLCSPANILDYWIPYTGLFVAGYFIGNNATNNKPTKLIGAAYSIGLLSTIVLSYYYFLLHNHGNHILDSHGCLSYYSDSYLSVNVVVMALCTFFFLMQFRIKTVNAFIQKLIFSIARASLGIYLLHTFFLDIFDGKLHLFDHIAPAWLYIVVKWIAVFTFSYISAMVFMKIPIVRRVFGETK